jgi:hypothetical protein
MTNIKNIFMSGYEVRVDRVDDNDAPLVNERVLLCD